MITTIHSNLPTRGYGDQYDDRVEIMAREILFRGDANLGISKLTTVRAPDRLAALRHYIEHEHTHTYYIVNATSQKRFTGCRIGLCVSIIIYTIYTQR